MYGNQHIFPWAAANSEQAQLVVGVVHDAEREEETSRGGAVRCRALAGGVPGAALAGCWWLSGEQQRKRVCLFVYKI